MNTVYTYPACFYPDKEVGGFTVDFPDLLGCVTEGDTMDEALYMAEDAACGWILTSLEEGKPLPPATDYREVKADADGFVNLMRLDIDTYAKKYSKKPVNKNCTIPTWLNTLAESKGVNFSQTLQEGLKQRLGLA
jgi:predicted RNase H-like HicB family nuclease